MENDVIQFIERKKKSKRRKKMFLFIIFFILLLILFLTKAPIFNISKVEYVNNILIKSDELNKLYEPLGENIFFINNKLATDNIKKNPYIESINIKKKMPNKLIIEVTEKSATYYVENGTQKYVLGNDLSLLEARTDVSNLNLILIVSPKAEFLQVGKTIYTDTRKIDIANNMASLIKRNESKIKFEKFEMDNPNKLIIYHGDVKINLGSDERLEEKLNESINILQDQTLKIKKGYIDVSFKGSPVIKKES